MYVPKNISNKQMRQIERDAKRVPIKDQISMFSIGAFLCFASVLLWKSVDVESQQTPQITVNLAKLTLSTQDLAGLESKHYVSVEMDSEKKVKLSKSVDQAERTLDKLNALVERRAKLNKVATEAHVYNSQGRLDRASAVLAQANYSDKKPVPHKAKNTKSVGSFAAEIVEDVVRDEMAGFVYRVGIASKVGGYVVERVSED